MKDEVVKAFSMMAALAAFLLSSSAAWADAAKPVLRAGLTLEVSTLDPVRATNYGENIIILNVYDMLVMPMPDNTVNGKLLTANKAEGQYGEFGDYGVKYLQNKDAGSGPYAIADFRAGEGITLKAFE